MKIFLALLPLLTLSGAAQILPIDTSIVNVKSERAGQDFSYSIHENRGFAIGPIQEVQDVQHSPLPVVKTLEKIRNDDNVSGGDEKHHQKEHHEVKMVKTAPKQMQELMFLSPHSVATYPTFYVPNYQHVYAYPYLYHNNYNVLAYRTF